MSGDLSKLSDDRLRAMLYQSRQMLSSLSESLEARPDMQNAIRRLMSPNDMLETFSELAVKNLTRLAALSSVSWFIAKYREMAGPICLIRFSCRFVNKSCKLLCVRNLCHISELTVDGAFWTSYRRRLFTPSFSWHFGTHRTVFSNLLIRPS